MKRLLSILLMLVLVVSMLLCSCGDSTGDTNTDITTNTNTDTSKDTNTDTASNSDSSDKSDKPFDEPEEPSFDTPIEHNLKVENSVKLDVFESENTFGKEGNTVDYTDAILIDVSEKANGVPYNIKDGGFYRIFGKTENGQILINLNDATTKDIVLIFDNLEMSYNGTKSVIYAEKCNSVKIIIPENTTTTLTDTSNNLTKGVIYTRSSNLTIDGKGTLNINANSAKSRGIFNTKTLTIEGGIYNVTTAYSHGIQGEEGLVINGGTFNINSAKSGLKAGDFDEDKKEEAVVGKLDINGGSFNINSKTNGISVYGKLTINNGRINIVCESDGIDVSDLAKLNGGITIITADNDGIKSDDLVEISGNANVKLIADNDGIDAKTVTISTSGIVYIKTNIENGAFVLDPEGTYIWKNNRFQKVDPARYPNVDKYILESCKGIKIEGTLTVENATLGIDSYEDAIDCDSIAVNSGRIVLYSIDDGIDIDENAEANGKVEINGTLEIIYSNKGIKAPSVTINEKGLVTVISTSDAIDSPLVTVNNGKLFLLEKLDLTVGKLVVNEGTVIVISSTKKAVTAETENNDISVPQYPSTSNALYGNWLRITDGEKSVVLRLPKSYEGKMSITCISSDIDAGNYSIDVGAYQVGDKINNFVYVDGEFTVIDTYEITLQ